jgi:hypothetical protein
MAILVFRVFSVVDGMLIEEPNLPHRSSVRVGDVAAVLTNLGPSGETNGPAWDLLIEIRSKGKGRTQVRQVTVPLQRFLTAER